jgi:hypothetical protein
LIDPAKHKIPDKGGIVEPHSVGWWQYHFPRVIINIEPTSFGSVKLHIEAKCHPVNGDKFTTLHGRQKGVVTILDDSEMPQVNGRHAEIVIGSSSVIKRDTTSQLLEAGHNKFVIQYMNRDSTVSVDDAVMEWRGNFTRRSVRMTDILFKYQDKIKVSGGYVMKKQYKVGSGIVENVKVQANFGTTRVMQSCFLASFKVSCTHKLCGSRQTRPNSRSAQGGSKSLGEMELMQLMASGLTHTLEEFITKSDMQVVEVCRVCRCISIACVCDEPSKGYDLVRLSFSTIKYILSMKAAFGVSILLK